MSSLGAAIESPSSWPPSGAVRSTRGGFWRKRLTSRPSWTLTGPTSPWSGSSSDPRSRSPSSSTASRKIKPGVNNLIFSLFFSQQKPTDVSCVFFVHNRCLAIVTIAVINDRPTSLSWRTCTLSLFFVTFSTLKKYMIVWKCWNVNFLAIRLTSLCCLQKMRVDLRCQCITRLQLQLKRL